MKFSLITPTHRKTEYLEDLYKTILAQSHEDWEWILWLNGDMEKSDVAWANDPRVRVFKDKSDHTEVGYHKHKAFMIGEGEVLVEVDHDDLLTKNCLGVLAKYFEDPEIGFVFSDNAKLHHQDKFQPYNPAMGWKHRKVKVGDKEMWAPITFPMTSHSTAFIWFAPDHVRAWRTSVYREMGGHNSELSILDDQELMIRTYLHTKVAQCPDVLYIYRIDGANTWLERGKAIQQGTIELSHKWSQPLAERDADLNGKLKVDVGGGLNPRPGYITMDIRETADIQADLNGPWPLEDNSVGVLNLSHVIEHLHDKQHTMKEIHRVLHHGGWAFIDVPSTDGRGAWMDPTHVSFWNQNSFFYYTKKEQARFIDNEDIRFQTVRLQTHYPSKWWQDNHIPVVSAYLIAIKQDEPRFPGPLTI